LRAFSIVDTRHVYDWVFNIYAPIGIGVFVLFTGTIVGAALTYRKRPQAARWHEANALEIGYAVLLTCVAAFLLYITFTAEHKVDVASAHEHPGLTVDVTAARWEWVFRYPRYGITHEAGAVGHQTLVVPTNVPVRFRLTSVDVIHSFWIPELGFKRDAMPGTTETVMLDFDHPGTFGGSCAEFCGLLHAAMVFTVRAVSPSAFRVWAATRGSGPA
jgi:cytochrome c oxidase subunit 2